MKSDSKRQKKPKQISKPVVVNTELATKTADIDSDESKPPAVDSNKLDDKLFELNDQFKERNKTVSESSSCSSSKQNEQTNANETNTNETNEQVQKAFILEETLSISSLDDNSSLLVEKSSVEANLAMDMEFVEIKEDTDYVNPRGVRFVQDGPNGVNAANIPYGLPCVRELLRFLISLISFKNSDIMISMGLNLLTIGLESGVDHLASYQSLLAYVKDDLCKKLYNLLSAERLTIYASSLRVLFLLFESLRFHLKLQLEHVFIKLMDIIVSDSNKISQEQKEMTIDYLLQLLRMPGFSTEIYLNFDCSLNCTNLFENLTKLLSKVSL